MQQFPLQQTPWLILYDGICGWCRDCVRCVSNTRSPMTQQIYHRPEKIESLGGFLPIFGIFRTIPLSLRNGIYDVIARHCYRLRGKLTVCYLSPEEYQDRFFHDV